MILMYIEIIEAYPILFFLIVLFDQSGPWQCVFKPYKTNHTFGISSMRQAGNECEWSFKLKPFPSMPLQSPIELGLDKT